MVHELLPLEVLMLLLEEPSSDSVEVAVDFVKQARATPEREGGGGGGARPPARPLARRSCPPTLLNAVPACLAFLLSSQVGSLLQDMAPQGLNAVMDRMR